MFNAHGGTIQRQASVAIIVAFTMLLGACGTSKNEEENQPPEIISGIQLPSGVVETSQTVTLQVGSVNEPDGDAVVYVWKALRGEIDNPGSRSDPTVGYAAPNEPGQDTVTVTISDAQGGVTSDSLTFNITVAPNVVTQSSTNPEPLPIPTDTLTPNSTTFTVPEPCIVSIVEPNDGAEVPIATSVLGTATEACEEGSSIWIVVEIGGLWWPQQAALSPFPQSGTDMRSWFVTAQFGGDNDRGRVFGIQAITTTADIDQEFADWFNQGIDTGMWPGFPVAELRIKGATPIAGLTVKRN
ncbi:MAG: PKD domain-containing protein [SAR202 cluster bacterium]|nr:PKD domain-containing protein [SAR202 cluster bacterium]